MTLGKQCDWRMLRNSKVSCIIFKSGLEGMNGAYNFKTERNVYHEQYEISDFPS